jgi:hypothetical protein
MEILFIITAILGLVLVGVIALLTLQDSLVRHSCHAAPFLDDEGESGAPVPQCIYVADHQKRDCR